MNPFFDIPFVSQVGVGSDAHRSDCGAACVSMLVKGYTGISITVDKLYDEMNKSGDGYLSVQNLQSCLQVHGVPTYWKPGCTLLDLFSFISNGQVPIVLFNYETWASILKGGVWDKNFKGAHFGIVAGMDSRYFYINDPLWPTGSTMPISIKHKDWIKVWDAASLDGNVPGGAIIPMLSVPEIVPEPPPIVHPTGVKYKVIVSDLKIRLSPMKTSSNWTGLMLKAGTIKTTYEERIENKNIWVRILPNSEQWIAVFFQGETLAIKV
jgi:hypothetical protein